MKKKLQQWIKDRSAAMGKLDALLKKAETENRDLNATENTEHTTLTTEIRDLDTKIDSAEEQIAREERSARLAQRSTQLEETNRPTFRSLADPSVQGAYSNAQIREIQAFSYVKAIREAATGRLSGLEQTMHEEAHLEARNRGMALEGNLGVPLVVMQRAGLLDFETRAITATGQTAAAGDQGGLAIQTNVGSIIERFYAKLLTKQMGATVLDGLVGNVLFPRHVTDDKAAAKSENAAAPVSSSTMNSITLSPRRVPVVLEVSRQFSMQTAPAVEAYLRDDLSFQIAKVIDGYNINGTGAANQPYGILNTAGITQLYAGATVVYTNGVPAITLPAVGTNANGAALSYADTLALIKSLAIQDAEIGKLGYLTNPKVRFALQLTPTVAGQASTYPEFVWPKQGETMNGYRCGVTTQVPSTLTKGASGATLNALIFGNWADALMGQWGGLDMLVNPYSKDDQGLIRINAWSFFDFNIRRPLSFAAILDAVAA